ncbi:MAG: hypothetical protein FJW90_03620 [Actinobacteria bacterium]|nr:hypothetical protein [Actinomycetota bacterium]
MAPRGALPGLAQRESGVGTHAEAVDSERGGWPPELGVRQVNVDSVDEVGRLQRIASECGREVDCVVRLQLGYEELLREDPSFESTMRVWEGKFGSSTANGAAGEVVERLLEAPNLNFVGLSHHVGFAGVAADYTREREVMHHRLCARDIAAFASSLPVPCERLDLGGGFRSGDSVYLASPGGGGEDAAVHELPSIDDHAEAIVDELSVVYPDPSARPCCSSSPVATRSRMRRCCSHA